MWILKFPMKTLVQKSIICIQCGDNNDRISKEKESTEMLKILGLIKQKLHVCIINMKDEKIIQKFRLKKID